MSTVQTNSYRRSRDHFEPQDSDPQEQRKLRGQLEQIDYAAFVSNREVVGQMLGGGRRRVVPEAGGADGDGAGEVGGRGAEAGAFGVAGDAGPGRAADGASHGVRGAGRGL